MTDDHIDLVRRRPAMWVGASDDPRAIHELLWEVVANAFDQVIAGHATRVQVILHDDGAFTVDDDGAGIPLDEVAPGVTFLEAACKQWHETPTFDGHAPHVHVGLRGIGLCPVVALSERFELETVRNGRLQRYVCERGRALARPIDVGATERRGTRVTVWPHGSVLLPKAFVANPVATRLPELVAAFDANVVATRLRELASLVPQATVRFTDRRTHVFHAARGLADLVRSLATQIGPEPPVFAGAADADGVRAEVAFAWVPDGWGAYTARADGVFPLVAGFVNWERMNRGSHVRGLMEGLADATRAHGKRAGSGPLALDTSELVAAVSVHVGAPEFKNSPVRDNLDDPATRRVVRRLANVLLSRALGDGHARAALGDRLRRKRR